MLNTKIRKRLLSQGEYGLFAEKYIRSHEFIWMAHKDDSNRQIYLTIEEIERLPDKEKEVFLRSCYQVDVKLFSGYVRMEDVETDDANFMNHSCDPNCWYNGDMLVARRDIMPGEEICYDYGTDATDRDWGFVCSCGSENCRGIITRNDWAKILPLYEDHFMSYLLQKPEFQKNALCLKK